MKVKMYNCGFGDCFLLLHDHLKILLDGGTIKRKSVSTEKNIIDDIKKELNSKDYKITGVLTHFHRDHYSFLKKLDADTFDDYYFPNIFKDKDFVLLNIYTYIGFNKRTEEFKYAKAALTLCDLTTKIKSSGKIHFVSAGNNIEKEYRVLWPDLIISHNEVKKVNQSLKDLLQVTNEEISEVMQNYQNIEENRNLSISDIQNILNENRYILNELKNKENNNITKEIKSIVNKLQNERSLVFDSLYGIKGICLYNEKNLLKMCDVKKYFENPSLKCCISKILSLKQCFTYLFLGDIDSENFNESVRERLFCEYSVIKVSHHGTKNHFTYMLPNAHYLLISNFGDGGSKNITEKYAEEYPNSVFICSNDTCEFRCKKEGIAKHSYCCGFTDFFEVL